MNTKAPYFKVSPEGFVFMKTEEYNPLGIHILKGDDN